MDPAQDRGLSALFAAQQARALTNDDLSAITCQLSTTQWNL